MKHLHFTSPQSSVLALPCGMGFETSSEARSQGFRILMKAMDIPITREVTRSELRVLDDFLSWCDVVLHKQCILDIVNPAFTYLNATTGSNFTFVCWCGYEDYGVSQMSCDDL